jgi:peptidoglycan/LPS O-acetylase OafA/YrhL
LVSIVCRNVFFDYAIEHQEVTHLRLDGLLLGVWLAHAREFEPLAWERLRPIARALFVPAIVYVLANEYTSVAFRVRVGFTLSEIAFAMVLVACLERRTFAIARHPLTYGTALCSYSLYLTHTFAIHGMRAVFRRVQWSAPLAGVLLSVVFIAVGGFAFYKVFEEPAIRLRDRVVPRRAKVHATGAR